VSAPSVRPLAAVVPSYQAAFDAAGSRSDSGTGPPTSGLAAV
jgi:hypothetical protein